MTFKKKLWGVAIAFVAAVSFNSQASLVPANYEGKETVTDSETGLEWLKLSETLNKSYEQVRNELTTTYLGFRFATNAEVEELMYYNFKTMWGTTWGKTFGSYSSNNSSGGPGWLDVNQLIDNFGYYYSRNMFYSYGFYYDEDSILRMAGAYSYDKRTIAYYYGTESGSSYADSDANITSGLYLVRAKPGDNLYSINDPLYDVSKNIVPGGPSSDVSAPFVSVLAGIPLLLAWRRQRKVVNC